MEAWNTERLGLQGGGGDGGVVGLVDCYSGVIIGRANLMIWYCGGHLNVENTGTTVGDLCLHLRVAVRFGESPPNVKSELKLNQIFGHMQLVTILFQRNLDPILF